VNPREVVAYVNGVALATDKVAVLVVDDSPDQRMLLLKYLERAGCDVMIASTAEEAISACNERAQELIVIDLVLPGMDGWDLAAHIHESYPTAALVITSVLDKRRYPAGLATLPKPFTGAQVRQVLQDSVPRWSAA